MEGKRQAKIARLIQKELSEIFRRQTAAMGNVLVSVSTVRVSPDLQHSKGIPQHIPAGKEQRDSEEHTEADQDRTLRTCGGSPRDSARKCPDLQFFLDDSLDYAENIDRLLATDPPSARYPRLTKEGKRPLKTDVRDGDSPHSRPGWDGAI